MPFLIHLFLFLLPSPVLLTHDVAPYSPESHRISRDAKPRPVKVVISEPCLQADTSDLSEAKGKEVEVEPGSPLVLTHRIRLVPGAGEGCGSCGVDLAALRERIERLEKEVSELREKCGGADGGCCTCQQIEGLGCTTVRPPIDECPDNCSDQGRCVDGKCVCFPGFSGTDCSVSDCPENCNDKGKCVNGQCVCDPGFTGPDCSQPTCPNNCRNRGRCVNGQCVCDAGYTGLDCAIKACPKNCSNRGRCVNGKCVCDKGFTGPDCSMRSCPANCNNRGRCVNGKCVCEARFTGPDCSERSCPGNCNKKGRCVNGQCVCESGFTGPDCSERSCPGNCKNKGRCVNGQCVCDEGFSGPDCSIKTCPNNCNNRGRCVNGKCVCESGFTGPDCSERSCPGNCNNKGRCVNGQCVCDEGFSGPDCSIKTCPNNCNNRGRCVNGKCVCEAGFTGPDCSERSCPGNCNNKGRCVNGQCVCDEGFSGPDCSIKTCPNNCNNRGRCVNGKCVCESGFTGPDCSERSCPGNCNNKGRCVDGQCVCDVGFTGPDCSVKACPANCNDHGKCVNGKCVCDPGFTGPDCSTKSCPADCSDRGQCVDGQCVCDAGFTGPDCSTKSCPNNCSNKGRCVNGKCVCDVGFTGQDCSTKSCPNNCSNHGRCVKGRCVCRRGFTGPDCSECEAGFTGPDCGTALTGVSRLSTRDITESTVTLFWTPPVVQYDSYHITFTSKKEGDQIITSKVSGSLTTYTQVGLAPGQQYTVIVIGEKDGKKGSESTTAFQTLISGPKDLEVVKTSTTSVIVQWEQAHGEIDRYLLTVAPSQPDGSGRGIQEIRVAPERDSAQIDGLEPGRLYNLSLVAEKDGTRSLPATVQATPGSGPKMQPNMTVEVVTAQISLAKDNNDAKTSKTKPNGTIPLPKHRGIKEKLLKKPLGSQDPVTSQNINASRVNVFTRPTQTRPMFKGKDKVLVRPGSRPDTIRKPNAGIVHFNGTRTGSPVGRPGQPPLKKPTNRYPFERPKTKTTGPHYPTTRDSSMALTIKETNQEMASNKSLDGTQSKRQPVKKVKQNGAEDSFSQAQPTSSEENRDSEKVPESIESTSESNEAPLDPTVTTEKNLTAHINGTKCVKNVLVGHRKIHVNGGPHEKTKNVTVIVSHINGDDTVHKILTDTYKGILFHDLTPLNEKEPKLQDKKTESNVEERQKERHGEVEGGDGENEAGEMSNTLLPTSHLAETFTEDPISVRTQIHETGTRLPHAHSSMSYTPTPSLPLAIPHFQPDEKPSTHDQFGNRDHLSRDRLPPRTSSKIFSRYPNSQKMSTLSTPVIKGRHPTRPFSFVKSSEISNNTHQIRRNPSVTLPPLSSLEQESKERKVMLSQENQLDPQGSVTQSIQAFSAAPSPSKFPGPESRTDTRQTNGASDGDQKVARNGTGQPFRRMPIKGTLPRKPNFWLFQNRTRPALKPPQHPYRSHPFRPNQHNVNNKDTARQTVPLPDTKPEDNNRSPNGSNTYPRPSFPRKRKNGTVIRLPPKLHTLIKPGTTTTRSGPKENQNDRGNNFEGSASNVKGRTKEPILTQDKDASEGYKATPSTDQVAEQNNGTFNGIAEGLEDSNNKISPRVTNGDIGTVRQSQPHRQDESENVNNQTPFIKPHLTVRRKNGTVPTKPYTQPKLNTATIVSDPEDSKHATRVEDSKVRLLPEEGASKGLNVPTDKEAGKINGTFEDGTVNILPILTNTDKSSAKQNVIRTPPDPKIKSPVVRFPPKLHVRPTGTTIPSAPKLTKDSVADKGSKVGLSVDKHTMEPAALPSRDKAVGKTNRTFPVAEGPEDSIDHVGAQNVTSNGFIIIWGAPKGRFKNFIITVKEHKDGRTGMAEEKNEEEEELKGGGTGKEGKRSDSRSQEDGRKGTVDRVTLLESPSSSKTTGKNSSDDKVLKKFTKVLPGSARSYPVTDLNPQTGYSVSLFGKGPGLRPNIHNVIVNTGPEPPTNLAFSKVTESSLTVSWTKPKSPVSGFKVTYTHTLEGEPVSVMVDSSDSALALSKLSPGSAYEVSVISVLGLDESDPIKDFVTTLPDPPTDLRAINITDTKALLLWRPALATVDQYVIVYGSDEVPGSELTITVSGNAVEQQLQSLSASTQYGVTIISQLGGQQSSRTTTIFTTTSGTGGRGEGPQDLTANQVTPRTAVLTWKPPASDVTSYRLTYFAEGGEMKEVRLEPGVAEYKLTGLHPATPYTARLQSERGGIYTTAISTEFTTGSLHFPFPMDCSQVLQNGVQKSGVVEIFPAGKDSKPVKVYCDMETDGGGWMVFQRRKDGKTNFFRNWKEYSKGFGKLDGEFWLGNELLHNLTTMTPTSLRVDMKSGDESAYAQYSTFSVDNAKKYYMIRVSGYSGTAGDSLKYHDRRAFSTRDRDPHPFITRCSMSYRGGWWYRNCHEANLNGLYDTHTNHQGVIWTAWKGKDFSIPFVEMKMRPSSFSPHTHG